MVNDEPALNIRKAFIPRSSDYELLCADYSQVEMRIAAHLSGDERLISLLQHAESKQDLYKSMAATFFRCSAHSPVIEVDFDLPHDTVRVSSKAVAAVTDEERSCAKTISLGILYGMVLFMTFVCGAYAVQ